MMWMQKQDSFKQKFGTVNQTNDDEQKTLSESWDFFLIKDQQNGKFSFSFEWIEF